MNGGGRLVRPKSLGHRSGSENEMIAEPARREPGRNGGSNDPMMRIPGRRPKLTDRGCVIRAIERGISEEMPGGSPLRLDYSTDDSPRLQGSAAAADASSTATGAPLDSVVPDPSQPRTTSVKVGAPHGIFGTKDSFPG